VLVIRLFNSLILRVPSDFYRLTEKEKARLTYKKNVLALATEHKNAGKIEKVDRYVMPDADAVSNPDAVSHRSIGYADSERVLFRPVLNDKFCERQLQLHLLSVT